MEALRHYNKAGTSCAFVTARFVYGFCLHPVSSVYSAELSAIEKALKIPRTGKFVLCSDPLSSLQAIRDI
ncbi:hypothetical protein J6590_028688 [Homalodisca vitripennis]|nr:hypothetical protein J6590_028688 [Homalodisca vitripennis]